MWQWFLLLSQITWIGINFIDVTITPAIWHYLPRLSSEGLNLTCRSSLVPLVQRPATSVSCDKITGSGHGGFLRHYINMPSVLLVIEDWCRRRLLRSTENLLNRNFKESANRPIDTNSLAMVARHSSQCSLGNGRSSNPLPSARWAADRSSLNFGVVVPKS